MHSLSFLDRHVSWIVSHKLTWSGVFFWPLCMAVKKIWKSPKTWFRHSSLNLSAHDLICHSSVAFRQHLLFLTIFRVTETNFNQHDFEKTARNRGSLEKRLKQMLFEIRENPLERLIRGLNQNQPIFIDPAYHLKQNLLFKIIFKIIQIREDYRVVLRSALIG